MSTSQEEVVTASKTTFLTALWLNAAIFGAELVVFTVLRKRFKAIYEPRTYIPPEDKRMSPLPTSLLSWPVAVWRADYKDVLRQNGMDAYVFLRFLRMMIKIFLPIWLISWAVLLPVTSINATGGRVELDMFTFGNVGEDQKERFAAHVILAWLFTGYILWTLQKEMVQFITDRHKFLTSPAHSSSAQANTILITGIPLRYLNEPALKKLFGDLPGGVAKVWVNHDLKDLPELYDARLAACNKLESAEVELLKKALKAHRKQQGKAATPEAQESGTRSTDALVPQNERPSHRLPAGFMPFALPFIGKKVDTIEWAKEEITRTTIELDKGRQVLESEDIAVHENLSSVKHLKYPPLNSAFILFRKQISAHLAAQVLAHHAPYRMAAKYTEVAPADVIWENLGMNPYEMKVRTALSYSATAALIIFWAIPVTAVGAISSVAALCQQSWLAWVCTLPSVVTGLIQGILPPVLLAVLNMLLPIVLRLFARFEGVPRRTGLELSLMTRFFIFQVLHNFIVLTLSSSILKTIQTILDRPTFITSLLATGLPAGSTFFMTYVILQGLTGSAAGFLQIVPLAVYYAKLFILGSTPRAVYAIKYDLRDVAWGTLFPSMTLITVIGIAYMIISPVMVGLACVAFSLFYMMWKYLFLWQLDQPASGDTGGLFFPKAIQHTMVGLYLQQALLAILLFLKKAVPQGAVIVVLIIFTAFFHIVFNNSFEPLIHPLPLTLSDRTYGATEEDDVALAGAEGFGGADDNSKEQTEQAIRRRSSADSASRQATVRSAQPIVGTRSDADNAYGASVPTEGKRNDGPTDFNHPASIEPQRIIWIPKDPLGLADAESAALNKTGVEASTENAEINAKGTTDISGHPPGMTSAIDP